MNSAQQACLRAYRTWVRAGRPGGYPQLALFEETRFAKPEAVRGRLADKPRRRKRRR